MEDFDLYKQVYYDDIFNPPNEVEQQQIEAMNREIDQMNLMDVVHLLKKYRKYENLTTDEIMDLFDTEYDIRNELKYLKNNRMRYENKKGLNIMEKQLSDYNFTSIPEINIKILDDLNLYDLYNACNSSKNLLLTCQQNPSLWSQYKMVNDVIKDIYFNYYQVLSKTYETHGYGLHKSSFRLNLYRMFPHLGKEYNYVVIIDQILIKHNKIILKPVNDNQPEFRIKFTHPKVILTFLVILCVHVKDFYSQLLQHNQAYIEYIEKQNIKRRSAKKSPRKKRY